MSRKAFLSLFFGSSFLLLCFYPHVIPVLWSVLFLLLPFNSLSLHQPACHCRTKFQRFPCALAAQENFKVLESRLRKLEEQWAAMHSI
jgi:hypothetical protein